MFKVMIADDESWIRKGLNAMVEWDRLGLTRDSEAADGMEALQLAEASMPDILITDVRMPGMDGLDLAAKMMERSPRLKVLIISGYSEFEYVRAAINIDAISYILKPINPAELNGTLEKAIEKLRSEQQGKMLAGQLPGYLEKLAADLCLGRAEASAAQAFRDTLQLRNGSVEYLACVFFHYDDSHYDAETMAHLVKQAEASLSPEAMRMILWDRGAPRIAALFLSDGEQGIPGHLHRLLLSLKRRNVSGVWVSVGAPIRTADCGMLSRSFGEALAMSERHPFRPEEEVVSYSPGEEETAALKYPMGLQKKLGDLLARGDRAGTETAVAEIPEYYRNAEGATLKHVRRFFLGVVMDAVKSLLAQPSFLEGIVEKGFDFCQRLEQYEDPQRMTAWLRGYLFEIIEAQETANQGDVRRNILAAADYIREHYAEEISLNSVSTRYFITSTYFSSMFKEIVGENFLEFLTRVRMDKAKELLAHSSVRVGQISEWVGYADSRYFSKLFKKHTGLIPKEYRERHSGTSAREGEGTR